MKEIYKKSRSLEEGFINYFKDHDHHNINSAPLLVKNDPSIMFNVAGMVQFKDWFAGNQTPKYKKVVTSQKCLRAGGKHNDLENVGYTTRHHTFFKMLGNFSFGDYFKEEAMVLAWNFLTNELGLNKNKLSITIHEDDQGSRKLWNVIAPNIQVSDMSSKDNFWSMGDTGPCGPCTEIFYQINDGEEPIEIWNLVFTQFNQRQDGKRDLLESPCVDTGMGLERLASVMQGVDDNYKTDLFMPFIEECIRETGADINTHWNSLRVVSDHFRASAFLIDEGLMPSNNKESYVLRKIIRRGLLHLIKLNLKDQSFLPILKDEIDLEKVFDKTLEPISKSLFSIYKELSDDQFIGIIRSEADSMIDVLKRGRSIVNKELENCISSGDKTFKGNNAFVLEDTYGFPIELLKDIIKEHKIELDEKEYEQLIEKRNQISKGALSQDQDSLTQSFEAKKELDSILAQITSPTLQDPKIDKATVIANTQNYLVLDKTNFHPQGCGQVGDSGIVKNQNSVSINVENTCKMANADKIHVIVHEGDFSNQRFNAGDIVEMHPDRERRQLLNLGHTSTHIMNQVLNDLLPPPVFQKGSHITPEKFTFDFTHKGEVPKDKLLEIEKKVNKIFRANLKVELNHMPYEDAIKAGARPLQGETYDDEVRVVTMDWKDQNWISKELCGGTHLKNTGEVGLFIITKESSISSGIRRIEAMTGEKAFEYLRKSEIASQATIKELERERAKTKKHLDEVMKEQRQNKVLNSHNEPYIRLGPGDVMQYHEYISDEILPSDIRPILNSLSKRKDAIYLVACKYQDKVSLGMHMGTANYNALDLLAKISTILGSSSGPSGTREFAQTGGSRADKLNYAIDLLRVDLGIDI